ncbi:glycosyltransferase family 4 protein [Clostridium pasteurianum]|uniref:Glycosyltransferase n=1 Tax=Clostridium pasteurianum BC1 TaxID=86416 RepID=R4KBD9_CLOPA|nr:glycosyltransferase family 4 protein [Clostridium pasteurianum]AGK97854.1 glycosyltransferase [Clostridium pasteurianum BC1]
MKYCVLYPKAENVHLIKDVGMIAYKLNRIYGYDSYVVSYNNDKYNYLNEEVKGLKMDFIERKHKNLINIFCYLKKNSKNIDVLQIFHMTFSSVIYACLYKFFNRKGIVFLKLDCTELLLDRIKNMKAAEKVFFNFFLNRVDIIGVEQKNIFHKLKLLLGKHDDKLMNIPNGIDFKSEYFKENISFNDKENIILNVGRIGSSEKATDLLMEAFALIDKNLRKDWKLVFVGPIEESFENTINNFFQKHEDMKDNVIFKGAIFHRKRLFEEYKRAKIFCLTSQYESVGIALIEAIACGDVIVSTRVGIAEEIVNGDNGAVVEVGDVRAIANALEKLISSNKLSSFSQSVQENCKENYNWDNIVEKLHYKINSIRGNN